VIVRPAGPADVSEVLSLINELAEFEELADEVVCTEEDLHRALFGPEAVVTVSLAVDEEGGVAGHALWYRTFSTFLGRTGIWLEDLYVRPSHRRKGVARQLLDHLRAQTTGRVEWEVLDWNAGAIAFYQGLGARPLGGWTKYRWLTEA
jgi:GNAT superfamily N-acetyltransferase